MFLNLWERWRVDGFVHTGSIGCQTDKALKEIAVPGVDKPGFGQNTGFPLCFRLPGESWMKVGASSIAIVAFPMSGR
ncbi:hypothetical protein GCM10027278_33030 [Paralcaligenes ginsengisoli]|jgi:hypothetical protein